jgi:hypothetical protein
MPSYDREQIIEDFKAQGAKAYTSFHKERQAAAKENGEDFPALETFRKWLVKEGLIENSRKKDSIEGLSIDASPIDPEFVEFIKDYLPPEIKEDLDKNFLRWKIKRLEETIRQLKKEQGG